ncbi:aminodeoxychorismate lyase [Halovenus sp. WSH3]|uniref:Aminodeoxychorismate lyase n=1 Tax=Halovenus carboxidivorans TaxID=2692199 RepID=A0A6B0T9E5_9EURY|nr:aminotransferase class IV [Halovenus carboxidivorans]MXR52866.1 aminodeoxychorismate lyase [Halovenus carboxidivorans]
MSERYHVDGELVSASEATVSVRDRGFMYGDGVFETLRVYGGEIFEWEAHADRLRRSGETLGFADALPSRDSLQGRIQETLEANGLTDAYAKVSVTRGVQPGKLTPEPDVDPTVVVYTAALPRGGSDGQRVWDEPAALSIVEQRKPAKTALPADAKTHSYLNSILARLELRDTEADEAIMRSVDGVLAEGATSNLFFVAGETLYTPGDSVPLLPGITRDVVVDIADDAGISTETGEYEPDRLADATEVFVTNSTWEIRPVTRVDDWEYELGPVTRELQRQFDERVDSLYD